jgi:hypothetical protein
MTLSYKKKLLKEYLGDFNEYAFTGWMFNKAFSISAKSGGWKSHWEQPLYPIESFESKFPVVLEECHCTTPIVWNCLIKHIPTGRLEFVGSTCMKYFRFNKKRCIECNKVHGKQTPRCGNCRVKCKLHKTHHYDNSFHEKRVAVLGYAHHDILSSDDLLLDEGRDYLFNLEMEDENEHLWKQTLDQGKILIDNNSKPFPEQRLDEGKWKGYTFQSLIGVDDAYLQWHIGYFYPPQRFADIDRFLLKTHVCFGKYQGKSFEWIKANDSSYYRWFKRTIDKAYVQHL